MPEPPSRYSGAQKALHWTMAALIVTQVAIAIAMTNLGEGPLTNTPFEPMPDWQRRAAQVSHAALYVLFILVPLVGWIATSYCCKPVKLFWTVPVSLPIPDAPTMEAAGWIFRIHIGLALVAVVAVHVAGALQHHFIRRDRTLLRMLPD